MNLGDLICEFNGKITSMKVLPFEDGAQDAKYEVTQLVSLTGRLTCSGIGSNYVRQSPDGTSVTKFYGLFTTPDGESIRAEFGGNAIATAPEKARFRTTGMLKSAAQNLAWLNTANIAFEGEGDFSSMTVTGKLYLWS